MKKNKQFNFQQANVSITQRICYTIEVDFTIFRKEKVSLSEENFNDVYNYYVAFDSSSDDCHYSLIDTI